MSSHCPFYHLILLYLYWMQAKQFIRSAATVLKQCKIIVWDECTVISNKHFPSFHVQHTPVKSTYVDSLQTLSEELQGIDTPFHTANGQASGGSPLGFHELFNEFRVHEGLHSMDDILGVIIDPDGMSFNDLKPIYKEFLLKLSVTLTKDELYQRSKSIMRRQRKKILRKTKSKTHRLRIGSKFRRLKHVFQRGLKWKLYKRPKKQKIEIDTVQTKLPESTISSSSYDTRHFTPKEDIQVYKKQTQKKKCDGRTDRLSTSEESDFLSIRRQKVQVISNGNQNRNSSSGYVSCSDCSYNSDSCTCTSADKCYCSLGNKQVHNKNKCKPKQGKVSSSGNRYFAEDTLTFCDCDTDSCAESNKCYCLRPTRKATLLEQLKQRGFVPPAEKPKKLCKRDSNTKSSKSLEYMHNPNEMYQAKINSLLRPIDPYYNYTFQNVCGEKHNGYCESLPAQYDFLSSNENFRKYRDIGILPRALSESEQLRSLDQSSSKAYKSTRYGAAKKDKSIQASSIAASTTCNEALSVKKTAEIAALFADMRLIQTTDMKNLEELVNPMVVSNNVYNKFRNNNSVTCRSMTYADISTSGRQERMIQNSLYGTGRNFQKVGNPKLFNSKNGLYTIQSQSDDSRRSSNSRSKEEKGFFLETNSHYHRLDADRNSLENSLGYLP
ncbi:hypothetical protein WA026_012619 [Henosepilachna vigintioctopunctata]|uniref:Uncharacterized protein n=1 Tax=Henosepilachna vigintioctopunctata TaxID=420089 RepID=A0AAW1U857_9CUCU